jgi:hypothetical protein
VSAHAREGQRATCDRCGRALTFAVVGHDAFTKEPVLRWIAVRRSKNAPTPITCPGTGSRRGYHRAEGYSVAGAPLTSRAS